MNILQFIQDHSGALIAAAVFICNEIIAFAPNLQSNSIMQLVLAGLKKIGGN